MANRGTLLLGVTLVLAVPQLAEADASEGIMAGAPGVFYIDPETYIGSDEVYVFCTVYSSSGVELWRAGTGIAP